MPDEIFFSIVESEVGGYEARAVGHSIFAQAETTEQQKVNVKHEVHSYFDQDRMPRVIHLARVLKNRLLGTAKGEFTVPDDFNDPLPKEIEDLFY